MDIQSWKRWHWATIGALAGAVVGWTILSRRDAELVGGAGYIAQPIFEQDLAMAPSSGYPRLRNFSIQRFGNVDIVDMERASGSASGGAPSYSRIKFAAPYPYIPASRRQPVDEAYTVRQFMLDAAKADPKILLSFAWWREPLAVVSISALAGIVALGGVWPFIIRLLIGAGFGKPVKDPNYDLSQFKSEPQPPPPAAPTAEQEAHLRALEEEMLRGMQQKPADTPPPSPAVAAPAVATLSAGELPPIERTPDEQKHYEGQYYPVSHPDPHKPHDDGNLPKARP